MRRRDLLLIVTRLACRVLHVAPWFNRMEYASSSDLRAWNHILHDWGTAMGRISSSYSTRVSAGLVAGSGLPECGPLRVCRLLAAGDDGGDILRGGGVVVDVGHGGLRLVSVDNAPYDYVVSIAMPKCHPIFF